MPIQEGSLDDFGSNATKPEEHTNIWVLFMDSRTLHSIPTRPVLSNEEMALRIASEKGLPVFDYNFLEGIPHDNWPEDSTELKEDGQYRLICEDDMSDEDEDADEGYRSNGHGGFIIEVPPDAE